MAAIAGMALAGCTPTTAAPTAPPQPEATSPFAACPPAAAAPASGPEAVPAVTLPCFTGGEPVALNRLGRPMVINLWASWCPPCRRELPALQSFADEAGDKVLVFGVVTDDRWNSAAWVADELGVRFPAVFDPGSTFKAALGRPALPVTLFVAADGSVRATDVSGELTLETVRALASEHLGYAP